MKNKGITLIALIITIIVMLILVAVTINMAVNGGLFGYAGNAARETEEEKQKELDWLNVNGMTTDQLIEKYTTERDEDLELLRLVLPHLVPTYTGNDETIINGIATLQNDYENGDMEYVDVGDNYIIALYHGKYYKGIGNWSNGFTTADRLNAKELLYLEIQSAIYNEGAESIELNGRWFYKYDNKLYKKIESTDTVFGSEYVEASTEEFAEYLYGIILEDGGTQILSTPFNFYEYNNNIYEMKNNKETLLGSKDEIAIAYAKADSTASHTAEYIVIRPTSNQTWNSWASTSNGDDLSLYIGSFKQAIISNENIGIINKNNNNNEYSEYTISTNCIYEIKVYGTA